MAQFNFPIIYGIERLRLEFCKINFKTKPRDTPNTPVFKEYIDIIDEDSEIKSYSIDDYKLCPKMLLFVLILTEMLDYVIIKYF